MLDLRTFIVLLRDLRFCLLRGFGTYLRITIYVKIYTSTDFSKVRRSTFKVRIVVLNSCRHTFVDMFKKYVYGKKNVLLRTNPPSDEASAGS